MIIDSSEDAAYVVKDGEITKLTPKEYGQDIIIWKNGQVLDVERCERIRIDGQKTI